MPVYITKQITWSAAAVQAMLLANKTLPGAALIAPGYMGLFKNDFTPTPLSVAGDLTPADFSGYSLSLTVVQPPHNLTPQRAACQMQQSFIATTASPFVPNTCYGYYIADVTGAILYASERFDVPIPIASVGDFISVNALLALPYVVLGQT